MLIQFIFLLIAELAERGPIIIQNNSSPSSGQGVVPLRRAGKKMRASLLSLAKSIY